MKRRFLPILLAVCLLCGLAGCGKSESAAGGDAAGFAGDGNSLDLDGVFGGGDSVDLSGMSGDGSQNRQTVDEDFIIVKVPAISYDDFGNGFYGKYAVNYAPLLERIYDEDGLLTSARLYFESSSDPADARIQLSYEKSGGMVTGCKISIDDMYAWYMYGQDSYTNDDRAKDSADTLQGRMPYSVAFQEPVEAKPDAVKAAVITGLESRIAELHDALLPPLALDFYDAFQTMYQQAFSAFGGTEQADDNGSTDSGNVDIGGRIEDRFRKRMDGDALAANYFGGGLGGEMEISNDPGWTSNMSVSHEDVICKIEIEKDSAGNLTLVHRYNNFASYDHVFTYDSANRMIGYDYYEYPNEQSREAVGAKWYVEYGYDSEGRLTKRQEVSNQDSGVNSWTEYLYDDMGRITGRSDRRQYFGNDFMTIQQTYDTVTQYYEYDETGKVSDVTVTVDWAQTPAHVAPPASTTVMYIPEK